MDSNAFLLSFGMKPEDFERTEGPIQSDEGFVYEGGRRGRTRDAPDARRDPASSRTGTSPRSGSGRTY